MGELSLDLLTSVVMLQNSTLIYTVAYMAVCFTL